MALDLGFTVQIRGATNAQGQITQFNARTLREIRKAADERGKKATLRIKEGMNAEYQSQWATGLLAAGVTHKAVIAENGVDVAFYIRDRRELRYVTSLLGGHFTHFPVGPFTIEPIPPKQYLKIPFPRSLGRRFIRGARGRFEGSKPGGAILVKSVLWGKKTGGFARDVLSELIKEEGIAFVRDMQAAVANSVVQVKS